MPSGGFCHCDSALTETLENGSKLDEACEDWSQRRSEVAVLSQ